MAASGGLSLCTPAPPPPPLVPAEAVEPGSTVSPPGSPPAFGLRGSLAPSGLLLRLCRLGLLAERVNARIHLVWRDGTLVLQPTQLNDLRLHRPVQARRRTQRRVGVHALLGGVLAPCVASILQFASRGSAASPLSPSGGAGGGRSIASARYERASCPWGSGLLPPAAAVVLSWASFWPWPWSSHPSRAWDPRPGRPPLAHFRHHPSLQSGRHPCLSPPPPAGYRYRFPLPHPRPQPYGSGAAAA